MYNRSDMPGPQSVSSEFQNRYSPIPPSDRVCVVESGMPYGTRLVANRPFQCGDLILPLDGQICRAQLQNYPGRGLHPDFPPFISRPPVISPSWGGVVCSRLSAANSVGVKAPRLECGRRSL